MTAAALVGDIEYSLRYIRSGALLLRVVSRSIASGGGQPSPEMSQMISFIADGILDHVETLQCAAGMLDAGLSRKKETEA